MRFIFKPAATLAAIAALIVSQTAAAAPRPWLLPSDVTFTGTGNEWLTVDAAISTDLYYPDHPGQPWSPVVTAPDGSAVAPENVSKGQLRLTFDVPIKARGTYKVAVFNTAVMGSFMLGGERRMLPRGTTPTTLASAVPAGATDVQTAEMTTRIETFATAGAPTSTVFTAAGKGIEMVPITHPTDLAVGERARFRFLLDGKPAPGLTVTAINGGVRYSGALTQLTFTTDAQGVVVITWPQAGMWWVSATNAAPRGEAAGGPEGGPPPGPPQPRATYAMTVQVLG